MIERIIRAATAVTLAGTIASTSAFACDKVQYLSFEVEDGEFVAHLNGIEIFNHDGGYLQGGIPIRGGLLAGENKVEIAYTDGGSGKDADFGINEGCDGGYPNETPVTRVLTKDSGTHTLTFVSEMATAPLPSPDDYEVTDGSGALDALHALQEAVKARDIDTVLAMHGPAFTKAEAMGMNMEFIRQFFTYAIENGEIEIDANPKIVALDGGRVYQMTTADGEPPITVSEKRDDGHMSWMSGYQWVRIDGKWGVLENF